MLDEQVITGVVVDDGRARARACSPSTSWPRALRLNGDPHPMNGKPLIDWDWIGSHLDDLWALTVEHLVLAFIAVGVGFAISFALSLLDRPPLAARLRPHHRRRRDAVRHPQPRPVRGAGAHHRPDGR